MTDRFKCYAFILLALRVLLDLAVSVTLYYQTTALVVGIGSMIGCSVFSFLLCLGIKEEMFRGRYGNRVYLSDEPFAYWFVAAFIGLFHLIVTALMIRIIRW